jgi:KaiC/GvpD/RAD55 family RecA-like ATPase
MLEAEISEPSTPHEAARLYASLHFRIVPIGIGKKWPEMPEWQELATDDIATIDHWYTGIARGHGVGLLMGYEGLFAVDLDVAEGKDGPEALRDLEDIHGALPPTVMADTPSGGQHLIFRAPEGVEIHNDQSGKIAPGIDIRGVGGQIVVAPTKRADGRHYAWVWGHEPWVHPIADAPDWLVKLATREEPPQVDTPPRPATPHDGPERPGDRFNRETTWPDLLEADGWTRKRDGPQHGEQRWTRPGKDPKDGNSATADYLGSDLLKVFTSSIPTLSVNATYTRFGYWAATHYGGDHAAAARALANVERIDPASLIGDFPKDAEPNGAAESKAPEAATNPYLAALIDWYALYSREPRELESWDGDGLLIKGRHTALVAKGGDGKSLLAVDILARLVTQEDGPRVLYVDWEMGEDDVYKRALNLGYTPDQLQGRLEYAHLPIAEGLDTPDGAKTLLAAVKALDVQIVVLDTYSRAVVGEENDADTVRSLYKNFSLPLRAMGVDQFRLDHLGKEATKGARGSSAKNDDVDQVWQLVAAGRGVTLTLTKNRANSKIQELHYLRREDPLRHECTSEAIPSEINRRLLADLEDLEPLPGLTIDQLTDWLKARGVAAGDRNKVGATYRLYLRRRDQNAVQKMVSHSGPERGAERGQETRTSQVTASERESEQNEAPEILPLTPPRESGQNGRPRNPFFD